MEALSCFQSWRRKQGSVAGFGLFAVMALMLVTVCFLASCADADTTNFSGFKGESDDWVGSCPADLTIGAPTAGMITATLTVMCDQRATVEETMSGPFVSGTGRYHAVVTGLKTAPNFSYDQDKNFDLTLASNGCTMSGAVADADGNTNVSFDSTAENCP